MGDRVAVIGLGYVGLTLATALADVGYKVVGVEKRSEVVDCINAGKPHFSESGLGEQLWHAINEGRLRAVRTLSGEPPFNVYIIAVGTPLSADGAARLDYTEAATQQVADHMRDGALIILRSTVKIGTARNAVSPILEASGKSFEIAMCPERTLEGEALKELRNLPQIIGADSECTRDRALHFFTKLTRTAVQVSSLETAEIIKLTDNNYRNVSFAFANEVARICELYGVNAMEVINGGKLGYPRTNVALPGLVGGPCLEKDPHILWQSLNEKGLDLTITRAARQVNEDQPAETAAFIIGEFHRRQGERAPTIAVLGIAFKGIPATDDLRGSMALKVVRSLLAHVPDSVIRLYDPVADGASLKAAAPECEVVDSVEQAIAGADIAIIANNHPKFGSYRPRRMKELMSENGFIYDYWNHFSDLRPVELRGSYFALGNSKKPGGTWK